MKEVVEVERFEGNLSEGMTCCVNKWHLLSKTSSAKLLLDGKGSGSSLPFLKQLMQLSWAHLGILGLSLIQRSRQIAEVRLADQVLLSILVAHD